MAITSSTPHDGDSTATLTMTIGVPDVGGTYIKDTKVADPNETVYTRLDGRNSERIAYKYADLSTVSTQLTKIYPPTTRPGYQVTVRGDWIRQSIDTDVNARHDDPEVATFIYRTTNGADVKSGVDVANAYLHMLPFILTLVDGDDGKELGIAQTILDKLMRGSTDIF